MERIPEEVAFDTVVSIFHIQFESTPSSFTVSFLENTKKFLCYKNVVMDGAILGERILEGANNSLLNWV